VRAFEGSLPDRTIQVNYDGFTEGARRNFEGSCQYKKIQYPFVFPFPFHHADTCN
jgi:hypothetical protein